MHGEACIYKGLKYGLLVGVYLPVYTDHKNRITIEQKMNRVSTIGYHAAMCARCDPVSHFL